MTRMWDIELIKRTQLIRHTLFTTFYDSLDSYKVYDTFQNARINEREKSIAEYIVTQVCGYFNIIVFCTNYLMILPCKTLQVGKIINGVNRMVGQSSHLLPFYYYYLILFFFYIIEFLFGCNVSFEGGKFAYDGKSIILKEYFLHGQYFYLTKGGSLPIEKVSQMNRHLLNYKTLYDTQKVCRLDQQNNTQLLI